MSKDYDVSSLMQETRDVMIMNQVLIHILYERGNDLSAIYKYH